MEINILGQAVQSPLGIVGLLFVVVAGISRAFFGPATPLRIRLIVFGTLFLGFSLFAVAILNMGSPDALDPILKVPKPLARKITKAMEELDELGKKSLSDVESYRKAYESSAVREPRADTGGTAVDPIFADTSYSYDEAREASEKACNYFEQSVRDFVGHYQSTVPPLGSYIEAKEEQVSECKSRYPTRRD